MLALFNSYLLKSLLLLTTFWSSPSPKTTSWLKCGSGGLVIYPTSETIGTQPLFLLEGSGEARSIIFGINENYPIYLKSGNQKVKLVVKESYSGCYNISQVVLKPISPLQVGTTYYLYIDNLPSKVKFGSYNNILNIYKPYEYRIENKVDKSPPQFVEKPQKTGERFSHLGCGDEKYVVFSCSIKDDSRTIVKTTVKNLNTQSTRTYYLLPTSNQLRVGRDMCEGIFDLEEGINYEAKFSPMDMYGNTTNWRGQGIIFSAPQKQTKGIITPMAQKKSK